MLFVLFFYFCVTHTDLFTSGNTAVTTLCCRQQMSSALYLTDFVSASISWLLGVQVVLVLPRYPLILLCVWFPALPLGPVVCCRTPSPPLSFVSRKNTRTLSHVLFYRLLWSQTKGKSALPLQCASLALLRSHVNSKEQFIFYSFDTIETKTWLFSTKGRKVYFFLCCIT